MRPIILGTGASEGIPAVFCECPVCARARNLGGKNVRSRSCMLFDEETLVDFSPDIFYQLLKLGVSLRKLARVFMTHFHEDHFDATEMGARPSGVPTLESPVELVCSPSMAEQMKILFSRLRDHNHENSFDYFQKYRFAEVLPFADCVFGKITATPVLSSHYGYGINEIGYNYVLKKGGASLLYAVDTGWYPKETWEYLDGARFGAVVIEATYGDRPMEPRASQHLNFDNVLLTLKKLKELGCVGEKTPVYLTHICHLSASSLSEIDARFAGSGFRVMGGWDGMEVFFEGETPPASYFNNNCARSGF